MADEVYVYLTDFPTDAVHEMVVPCVDGYTIYIDIKQDEAHRMASYNHAMEHIHNRDWEKEDVQQIEAEAHHIEPMIPEERKQDDEYIQRVHERIQKQRRVITRKLKKQEARTEFIEKYWGPSSDYALMERDRSLWDF